MNELNELQNIWKTGKTTTKEFSSGSVSENLIEKLKTLESNQTRINRLKIFVLIMIFTQMVYWLNRLDAGTVWVYSGLGVIFTGVTVFMFYYMRNQFNIKRLDFTSPSISFIDDAANMLEKQNSIFKGPFLLLSACLLVGANIMAIGFSSVHEDKFRMHMIYSFLLIVSTFWGHRIRMRRIRKEVTPLLDELKTLKENLRTE